MIWLSTSALADGVRFTLSADVEPSAWPGDDRKLVTMLDALLETMVVEGTYVSSDGSFDLDTTILLGEGNDVSRTDLRIYGLDSHWGVESSLLGDTDVMINHLALMEFAVKAHDRYDLPLTTLSLLSPYAHRSAFAAFAAEAEPVLHPEEGTRTVSRLQLFKLAQRFVELSKEDRALYYWCEVMKIETGLGETFTGALEAMPATVFALFPKGITITKAGSEITYASGDTTYLHITEADGTRQLTLTLPDIVTFGHTVRKGATFTTGAMHVSCALLDADVSYSIPTALPVNLPFSITIDAQGPVLTDGPLHLTIEGEGQGDTVILRQLSADHSAVLTTATIRLSAYAPAQEPAYTPETVTGMNLLSVNGDSLAELLSQIKAPLMSSVFSIVVSLPPNVCQTLMDALEDSGLLDTLSDALLGTSAIY